MVDLLKLIQNIKVIGALLAIDRLNTLNKNVHIMMCENVCACGQVHKYRKHNSRNII